MEDGSSCSQLFKEHQMLTRFLRSDPRQNETIFLVHAPPCLSLFIVIDSLLEPLVLALRTFLYTFVNNRDNMGYQPAYLFMFLEKQVLNQ